MVWDREVDIKNRNSSYSAFNRIKNRNWGVVGIFFLEKVFETDITLCIDFRPCANNGIFR